MAFTRDEARPKLHRGVAGGGADDRHVHHYEDDSPEHLPGDAFVAESGGHEEREGRKRRHDRHDGATTIVAHPAAPLTTATPTTTRTTPPSTFPVMRSSPRAVATRSVKTGNVATIGATTVTVPTSRAV